MSSPNNDVFSLDPHCLDCSYNLRGHAGDPIRCPECGHVNRVEDLEVPANLIRKALRRLESGAAMCGASAATLLLWVVPLLIVMANPPMTRAPAFVWVFITTLGVAAMVCYVVGMIRFRRSCGGKSRWLPTLLWFTTLACLIAAAILSAMAAAMSCIPIVMDLWPAFPINIQMVARLGAAILLLVLSTWLYRVAKRAIHPLQRETAARLARARYGSNP